jgi:hypothetical protein
MFLNPYLATYKKLVKELNNIEQKLVENKMVDIEKFNYLRKTYKVALKQLKENNFNKKVLFSIGYHNYHKQDIELLITARKYIDNIRLKNNIPLDLEENKKVKYKKSHLK